MADIPENDILKTLRSRIETDEAVEAIFAAALGYAQIARKPLYSPEEAYKIGAAITEASYELLKAELGVPE
ncbi:MAG: hypothetical protein FJZ01_20205 [Candidatus Sericytochromatia bacterium]|nr:hypothetical protein [Candidatus Tanganyikabacteria bacterium]